jgi:spermidine synthase
LADLTAGALDDPRVRVEIGDAAAVIERAAREAATASGAAGAGFDAIVLDLYEGPRTPAHGADDPLYGRAALERCRAALAAGGVLAVWSEDPDAAFERRLLAAGFRWRKERPAGHGRHTIYIASPEPAGLGRGSPPRRAGGRSGRR